LKVFIIGIDGASWNVVGPLLEQGFLSNLGALIESGTHGNMNNLGETQSPIIWTTIATGKLPDQHRIQAFTGIFGRYGRWQGRHLPSVVRCF